MLLVHLLSNGLKWRKMTATETTFLEDVKDSQIAFVSEISTQIWMSDPNLLSVRKTKVTLLEAMIEILDYWFRDHTECELMS